jgi:hypothetical protein
LRFLNRQCLQILQQWWLQVLLLWAWQLASPQSTPARMLNRKLPKTSPQVRIWTQIWSVGKAKYALYLDSVVFILISKFWCFCTNLKSLEPLSIHMLFLAWSPFSCLTFWTQVSYDEWCNILFESTITYLHTICFRLILFIYLFIIYNWQRILKRLILSSFSFPTCLMVELMVVVVHIYFRRRCSLRPWSDSCQPWSGHQTIPLW